MDDVTVVLDAVLNFTAVDSGVAGPQPRYLDAGVRRRHRVAHQVNSVQVALADTHLSLQGHEDRRDFVFGDAAPFDAMRKGSDGGSPRVWDSVVLQHHNSDIIRSQALSPHKMRTNWRGIKAHNYTPQSNTAGPVFLPVEGAVAPPQGCSHSVHPLGLWTRPAAGYYGDIGCYYRSLYHTLAVSEIPR